MPSTRLDRLRDLLCRPFYWLSYRALILANWIDPPDRRPLCVDCQLEHVADGEECWTCRQSWEEQQRLNEVDRAAYAAGYQAAIETTEGAPF